MDSLLPVLPGMSWLDAGSFLVYSLLFVLLPGDLCRRLLGWQTACSFQRFAATGVCGACLSSLLYFVLMLFTVGNWYLPCMICVSAFAGWYVWGDKRTKPPAFPLGWQNELLPWLLVVGFAAYYLLRVQMLVEVHPDEVRFYGAWYSDKMTNMCSCESLLHEAPPQQLRMAGYGFPSHFFPHLFVAAASKSTGVGCTNLYWFYATAMGILITGAAVVGFCRRLFTQQIPIYLAVTLVAIFRFGPEAKPLDLSLAALLLGLICLDRFQDRDSEHPARHWRWAVLGGALIGIMPCYEGFTAATAFVGVWAWAMWQMCSRCWNRNWGEGVGAIPLAATATVVSFALLSLIFCSTGEKQPPSVVISNTYFASYEQEWCDLYQEAKTEQSFLHQLAIWHRNKPVDEDSPQPTTLQKTLGRTAFYLGFLPYWCLRFLHVGWFGLLLVPAIVRKSSKEREAVQLLICVAAIGLLLPAIVNWGREVEGQWWWTPNIYRFTSCGMLLLAILGAGACWEALRRAWKVRHAIPLAVAGYMVVFSAWHELGLRSIETYHPVASTRLEALAFLRREVPYGEVVVHPWQHDLIFADERFSHVYKDHFTLGSNLAGQQMYYEGREDHLFINGVIPAEVVMQRKRNRTAIYQSSDQSSVNEMLKDGEIRWLVADNKHPAPAVVQQNWPQVFANNEVFIYRRPAVGLPEQIASDSPPTPRQ